MPYNFFYLKYWDTGLLLTCSSGVSEVWVWIIDGKWKMLIIHIQCGGSQSLGIYLIQGGINSGCVYLGSHHRDHDNGLSR